MSGWHATYDLDGLGPREAREASAGIAAVLRGELPAWADTMSLTPGTADDGVRLELEFDLEDWQTPADALQYATRIWRWLLERDPRAADGIRAAGGIRVTLGRLA